MAAIILPPINVAVEGDVDAAVVQKVIRSADLTVGQLFISHGKQLLLRRLANYSAAAAHAPWVILVDLDQDFQCAPQARSQWVPQPSSSLCLRIAVRAVEAWLLADSEHLAEFLRVRSARFPMAPESLSDPKRALIDLSQFSTRSAMRADMIPRPGSGRAVGPAYTGRMIEFVNQHWDPNAASARAPSLEGLYRCLSALCT